VTTPTAVQRSDARGSFWLRWALVNIIGFTSGVTLAGALIRIVEQPYSGVVTSAAEGARIQALNAGVAAAVFGGLLGTLQWVALRTAFHRVGWWIPATTLGYAGGAALAGALGGALGGAVTTVGADFGITGYLVATVVGILVAGLLPSALQWLVLRQQLNHAGWWVLVSGGSLFVGLSGGLALARLGLVDVVHWLRPEDFPSAKSFVVLGVMSGLLYAAMTGALLVRLLRQFAPTAA
jgi:hypothetical protein